MKKKILLAGSILGLFLLFIFVIRLVFFTPRGTYDPETPLSDVRVLLISLVTYYDTYDSFPPDLRSLGGYRKGVAPSANAAGLISDELASSSKLGYRFTYRPFSSKAKVPLDRFTLNVDPIDGCSKFCVNYFIDERGVFHDVDPDGCTKDCNHYFADEHGVIHVEANSPATPESRQIKY